MYLGGLAITIGILSIVWIHTREIRLTAGNVTLMKLISQPIVL